MLRRRWLGAVTVAAAALALCLAFPASLLLRADAPALAVPGKLADQEFWALVTTLSEPSGSFRSDNLLSNELRHQFVIPALMQTAKTGRAYIGVGPEQNFTYIAALQPSMAFIVDIRRGNLQLHLMYKALFELSSDRADFVSRLFSRKEPDGLRAASTAAEIFDAYGAVEAAPALYDRNLKALESQLAGKHGFALSSDDLKGIEYVYHSFFTFGPGINYSSTEGVTPSGGNRPTYADLMTATDTEGRAHSFLASEEAFASVKLLQSKNLIVPIVGDFAGPRALRSVGAWLTSKSAIVSAFYVSNVEQYLRLERVWGAFCANAARLPIDETSTFIRAGRGGRYARGGTALTAELSNIAIEVDGCDRRP
jgi:hypothetical protein